MRVTPNCPTDAGLQPVHRRRLLRSRPYRIRRLFVYGSLAPGEAHEAQLKDVPGCWRPASVRGTLIRQTPGAAGGYPGIVLDERGGYVDGLLFSSDQLPRHWSRLDEFEGTEYARVLTLARLPDGAVVETWIYEWHGAAG